MLYVGKGIIWKMYLHERVGKSKLWVAHSYGGPTLSYPREPYWVKVLRDGLRGNIYHIVKVALNESNKNVYMIEYVIE